MKFQIPTYWGILDMERNTFLLAVGVFCCLQICNSVVILMVKGLVPGQRLMVISTLLLCKSIFIYYIIF